MENDKTHTLRDRAIRDRHWEPALRLSIAAIRQQPTLRNNLIPLAQAATELSLGDNVAVWVAEEGCPRVQHHRAAALVAQHRERWSEAADAWRSAQEAGSKSMADTLELAHCLAEDKRVAPAIDLLEGLRTGAREVDAIVSLATIASMQEDFALAADLHLQAYALSGEARNRRSGLQVALAEAGRLEEARALLPDIWQKKRPAAEQLEWLRFLVSSEAYEEADTLARGILEERIAPPLNELLCGLLLNLGRQNPEAQWTSETVVERLSQQAGLSFDARVKLVLAMQRTGALADATRELDQFSADHHTRARYLELQQWFASQHHDHTGAAAASAQRIANSYHQATDSPPALFSKQGRTEKFADGSIVAFTVLRDEVVRLPDWLNHHRALGVEHFVVVDNGSVDGSVELLEAEPDVSVYLTTDNYFRASAGMRWINQLVADLTDDCWCLYLDVDELLIYPGCETQLLPKLTDYLDRNDFTAMRGFMLDMHPETIVDADAYEMGDKLIEHAPYFWNDYTFRDRTSCPYWDVRGGIRWATTPRRSLDLTKTPLIRSGADISFLASSHVISHARVADVTASLLHFRFSGTPFKQSEAETAAESNAYILNRHTQLSALAERNASFLGEKTVRYVDSFQLLDLHLLRVGEFDPETEVGATAKPAISEAQKLQTAHDEAVAGGDVDLAYSLAMQAKREEPSRRWWRPTYIQGLERSGELEDLDQIEKALLAIPGHPALLAHKARLLERKNDFLEACDVWQQIREKDPTHLHALKGLLRCHQFLANDNDLIDIAREAANHFPGESFWRRPLGTALWRKDTTKARTFLEEQRASGVVDGRGFPFDLLTRNARSQGDWQSVIELTDECAETCQGNFWWFDARAVAFRALDQPNPDCRVQRHSANGKQYVSKRTSPERATRERQALELAARRGIAVPACADPVLVGESGKDVLVTEVVPGVHLTDVDLDESQLADAFSQIGGFLAKLHSIKLQQGYGALFDDKNATRGDYLGQMVGWIAVRLAAEGEPALAVELRTAAAGHVADSQDGPPSFCHGDLHAGNILFDFSSGDPEITGAIDFESALAAEPALDLGRMLAFDRNSSGEDQFGSLLAGYLAESGTVEAERVALFAALHLTSMYCGAGGDQDVDRRPILDLIREQIRLT